ncbi:MAG: NAD(P)-dependent oxidoreductase [Planctomycetes bacterium]|nr:NAD(P)-dependent oxidoreductase [Planctomycetota bacterium]
MRVAEIRTEAQLDELLSEPTPEVIDTLARWPGDLMFLGAAGKMGPTLARMALRASVASGTRRRIYAVARFSSGGEREFADCIVDGQGIEPIRCDLADDDAVARLPDAPLVVFMAGRKFGSTGDEPTTWAMNAYVPGAVCRRFRRSRIVAFSTGNVYGLSPVAVGGSRETDQPQPVGEYAMSALGRERVFEYFSRRLNIPLVILRLNYACELRYGVLVDLAQKIWADEPIDLAMGTLNTIWQGDANAMTLRAFDQATSPATVLNMTGTDTLSVRQLCGRLGELLGRTPKFVGAEAESALLSNASVGIAKLGVPRVPVDELLTAVAGWIAAGGRCLGKPTHFESRDGKF